MVDLCRAANKNMTKLTMADLTEIFGLGEQKKKEVRVERVTVGYTVCKRDTVSRECSGWFPGSLFSGERALQRFRVHTRTLTRIRDIHSWE